MENKYYTPTIEEFHVGFECEMVLNGCPSKCVIEEGEEETSESTIKILIARSEFGDTSNVFCAHSYEYRVKYLDREDIEQCGWISMGSAWYDLKDVPGKLGYYLYVRMRFFDGKALIKAYRYDPKNTPSDVQEEGTLFDGVIKNKSELKKIMKQLGIC